MRVLRKFLQQEEAATAVGFQPPGYGLEHVAAFLQIQGQRDEPEDGGQADHHPGKTAFGGIAHRGDDCAAAVSYYPWFSRPSFS